MLISTYVILITFHMYHEIAGVGEISEPQAHFHPPNVGNLSEDYTIA